MSKFQTLVVYVSGRKEVHHDKNAKDMKKRREALSALGTVKSFKTPTPEDLMEAK